MYISKKLPTVINTDENLKELGQCTEKRVSAHRVDSNIVKNKSTLLTQILSNMAWNG